MFWVVGAVVAAILTGFGSRISSTAGESSNPTPVLRVPDGAAEETEADDDGHEEAFYSQAVVLEREGDGHFYADTEINGQKVRMLVDTGATAIALSRDDARRAGVGISIAMPEVVGKGASGDVHGEIVTLDRVALGGAEAENVAAVVLDDGEMSLLGQSFLARFDSVEIKGDRMVLK